MKLFKQITIISALFLFAPACTDYVDYDPVDDFQIVADAYFHSADDYEAAVVGTYDPLQWMYLNILIGDIASDNSFSGGESATDVVVRVINVLEDSPLFNAGKGAVFTHNGENELDASIMEGHTLNAGAVAGVSDIKNPIEAILKAKL